MSELRSIKIKSMFKTQYLIFIQRLWQGCAGILTLVAITYFITPELQGWYYSFLSLSAIYVVFDHGLSHVLVQTSAHSFLKSNIEEDSLLNDEDRKSLHMLVFSSFQRYQKISLSFLLITSTSGFIFFNSIDSQIDKWEIAWICLIFAVAINLLLFPFLSIIEGSGKISSVYKLRFIQSVVGSLCCWGLLFSDSPLWAPIAVPTIAVITQTAWLLVKWKHLLIYAKTPPVSSPQWDTTIWPLEWRVALSYVSTYTLTQFITPIVFLMCGSKLAGQVGLSLAVTNMIALLSFSGITGNIPGMAKNAALKNWGQMDLLFSKGLKFGFTVYILASGMLLLTFYLPSLSQFTDRALPPDQILILLSASFLAQIHASLVVQLRSYLVEPLLWISFWAVLLMGMLILISPQEYGLQRIINALLLTQLFFILPLSLMISKKFNAEWRYSEHILRKSKMTLQANKLFGSPTTNSHTVSILMATYNGDEFLIRQLASLKTQSHENWHLHVSDDGSSDDTMKILKQFRTQNIEKVTLYIQDKNLGFVSNFMSLILNKNIQSDYYALCDQDDIWLPNKLEHALKKIKTSLEQGPKLYCARTLLVNAEGRFSGFSPAFRKAPNLQNAIVQSISGGNTMVYNQEAHEIITGVQTTSRRVVSHDWWIYLLMTAVDAQIIYDLEPSILYRQHKRNAIGSNARIVSRMFRLKKLITGEFGEWISHNMVALDECQVIFSNEKNYIVATFQEGRKGQFLQRFSAMRKSGVRRQSTLDNVALWIALILKKV